MITAVTGVARSGTSLMMQMLKVGGLEPFSDSESGHSHETRLIFDAPDWSWLDLVDGCAVKFLDPHRYMPLPAGPQYRFILMRRDPTQQALSIEKFARALLPGVPAGDVRMIAASIKSDIKKIRSHLRTRGRVLEVHFEKLLEDPVTVAQKVVDFCEGDVADVAPFMAGFVLDRPPECLPGLLETHLETFFELADKAGVAPRLIWERMREEELVIQ